MLCLMKKRGIEVLVAEVIPHSAADRAGLKLVVSLKLIGEALTWQSRSARQCRIRSR